MHINIRYIYFYIKRKKQIRMDVDELELVLGQKLKYTEMNDKAGCA